MRSIQEWQRAIGEAEKSKFPNNRWSQLERAASIQRQLDDVLTALKVESGEAHSTDHAHQDPDHRIAALIADILILAHTRGTDVESELQKVLKWFERRD